jgi:hypothetical protein
LASISLLTDKRSLPKPVKAASEGGNSA